MCLNLVLIGLIIGRSYKLLFHKFQVLTNNLGRLLGVDKAETIWDKVADASINFTQFIQVLSNNLLVGIDKNPDTKVASLKAEIDHLCWLLCEKSYLQQIKSNQTADSHNGDSHFTHSDSDFTVTLETVSEKEFSKDAYFKLWKVNNDAYSSVLLCISCIISFLKSLWLVGLFDEIWVGWMVDNIIFCLVLLRNV